MKRSSRPQYDLFSLALCLVCIVLLAIAVYGRSLSVNYVDIDSGKSLLFNLGNEPASVTQNLNIK